MKRRNTTENRPLNEGEAMMNQINISIRTFMIIMGLFLILTENAYGRSPGILVRIKNGVAEY